jgi:hypothetical protein
LAFVILRMAMMIYAEGLAMVANCRLSRAEKRVCICGLTWSFIA